MDAFRQSQKTFVKRWLHIKESQGSNYNTNTLKNLESLMIQHNDAFNVKYSFFINFRVFEKVKYLMAVILDFGGHVGF